MAHGTVTRDKSVIIFWLILLPIIVGVAVIGIRRWPIIVVPLTAASLVAMSLLISGVNETVYAYLLGRLLQLESSVAWALGYIYLLTAIVVLAGYRLGYTAGINAVALFFISMITASVTIQDGTLGALFLGAAATSLALMISLSWPDQNISALRVLSVLTLIWPMLVIALWALGNRALNPHDESFIRLGGASLVAVMAVGLGVFPLCLWLLPIYRQGSPLAILFSYIFHCALLVRISFILTTSLWPGGHQVFLSLLVTAGLVTVIGGGLLAAIQNSLSGILGFSSIASMGTVLAAIGLGSNAMARAAILNLAYHGIALTGASICLGLLRKRYGGDTIMALKGAWKYDKIALTGFLLNVSSLAGIPLMAGFTTRLVILSSSSASQLGWVVAAMAATVGPGIALGRLILAARGEPADTDTALMLPAYVGLAAGCLLLVIGLYPRVLQVIAPEWLKLLAGINLPLAW